MRESRFGNKIGSVYFLSHRKRSNAIWIVFASFPGAERTFYRLISRFAHAGSLRNIHSHSRNVWAVRTRLRWPAGIRSILLPAICHDLFTGAQDDNTAHAELERFQFHLSGYGMERPDSVVLDGEMRWVDVRCVGIYGRCLVFGWHHFLLAPAAEPRARNLRLTRDLALLREFGCSAPLRLHTRLCSALPALKCCAVD